jgi:hypothetical protein
MAWLDARIEFSHFTFRFYIAVFEREWVKYVGAKETIPQEYKDKVMKIYHDKKAKYEDENQERSN